MLDTIRSHQIFRPLQSLKTKYRLYVVSGVFTAWAFILFFFGFIRLLAGEPMPRELVVMIQVFLVVGTLIILLGYFVSNWYYNSISYEIVADEVHVFRGIITKTRKIVPYRTITNFDIKQGPFDRLFNLGTIEIQTAGNSASKTGPEERLDGLPADIVQDIQDYLVDKVRKVRGSAGTSHDPDHMDEESILAAILEEVKLLRKSLNSN